MKLKRLFLALLTVLLLASCNLQSKPENALSLALIVNGESFDSFGDVSATILLKNIGTEDVLINSRFGFIARDLPSEMVEGVILITDNAGEGIWVRGKVEVEVPREDMFVVLSPGQTIKKNITLESIGLESQYFKSNVFYTIVAVYQNSLEIDQMVNGKEIFSWTGRIESNTGTFIIAP